jgi:leucyl-tRNA synthetase
MSSTNENAASTTVAAPPHRYSGELAQGIESRWQGLWQSGQTFRTPNPGEAGFARLAGRPKRYVLDMFPYPSGVGLHVGHPLGYIATDIAARFARMTGCQVLHAMGYDAFGLPAEQYAVQTGQHPRVTTEQNIETMRRQLRRLGLGHDDRRGVATTDVAFYRWTQWIFLQIYNAWYDDGLGRARPIGELVAAFESGAMSCAHDEHNPGGVAWGGLSAGSRAAIVDDRRLAYLSEAPVNWCPALGTVLSNEEVTADGRSDRGNFPVFKRPLRQWMMRITSYCRRLLDDLEGVDWPEPIKLMQRNWIGRSEGAFVTFALADHGGSIEVFTTRPDTLFGATYMVMAPEHGLVDSIVPGAWPEGTCAEWTGGAATPGGAVAAYRRATAARSDVERQVEAKEKTGVFTGAYAVNPVNGERIPVFIADYVLMGYGSGAIMAVPAHDERDFEFAQQFALPMRDVVYSHTVMRIREFTGLVSDPGALPEGWFNGLCDFIGMMSAGGCGGREAVDQILLRRAPVAADVDQSEIAYEPGSIGESRGVIREVWTEALGRLSEITWDELVRRFREADYRRTRGGAYPDYGTAVNSPPIDGLETPEAKRRMIEWLELKGIGRGAVTYKLRDWLFSRQRYWGEPFPIVFDQSGAPHALPESMLPVELPAMENFAPEIREDGGDADSVPAPPLSRATAWATVDLDLGDGMMTYTRELNTMPQWAGSCWYYLRYLDPENDRAFCDPEVEERWMSTFDADGNRLPGGVDLYVGGAEHAVLHLLYARFWHKALHDLGHVSCAEPFQRLFNQGYIQAYAYKDARGVYVDAGSVEESADGNRWTFGGEPVSREYGKMGKSLKNAVAPDEICDRFGADTLRLYEMYLGPLEQSKPWNTRDIVGVHRFLQRLWRCVIDEGTGRASVSESAPDARTNKLLHKTIAGVREDLEGLRFNTAIAKLIELTNHLTKLGATPRVVAEAMTLMLSPLAPHIAEELADRLGMTGMQENGSIAYAPFPVADASLLVEDEVEIPVQVGGKVRARILLPADADAAAMESAAMADETVRGLLAGKTVRKVVCVPGKMVNIVTG